MRNIMKTPLRHVLVIALFSLPVWSGAATWSTVIANAKMRAEIDLASFLRQGNVVTAWDREVHFEPTQARPGDFYFKSAKSLVRYSCDVRTADLIMKVYYGEDGSEIKTVTASYDSRPNYVIPDTEGEQKFEYACKYKKVVAKKVVAVAKKKAAKKPKAPEKTAESGKKEAAGAKTADTSAKPAAPENPPKFPPRILPIRKPSGILPPPSAETDKGAASK